MRKQKKSDLKIITIGKSSIEALPEAEQKVFFETLLERIKALKAEDDKKDVVESGNENNDIK